jgi:hypothetical protein
VVDDQRDVRRGRIAKINVTNGRVEHLALNAVQVDNRRQNIAIVGSALLYLRSDHELRALDLQNNRDVVLNHYEGQVLSIHSYNDRVLANIRKDNKNQMGLITIQKQDN